MANLYRLILAFILASVSLSSYALIPKVVGYKPTSWQIGTFSTPAGACNAILAYVNSAWGGGGTLTGCSDTGADVLRNGTNPYRFPIATVTVCPENSNDAGGGQCQCVTNYEEKDGQCVKTNPCPLGQHEEGGACVPDNCKPDEIRVNGLCVKEPDCPEGTTRVNGQCKPNGCEKGKNVGIYETGGADSVEFLCEEKCTVRVATKYEVSYTNSDGKRVTEYSGDGILTGGSCTGGTGGGGSSGPGGGGEPGGGGGGNNNPGGGGGGGGPTSGGGGGSGPTKLPGVKPPDPKQPDTEGNCAAGQTKGADGKCYDSQPKPPDSDGKCPAGYVKTGTSCVPLTPSVGGGGGGTGGGNGDGEGDGSVFGGSCIAGFVCEGDAVQCAIAREQHRRNCVLFNDPSDESRLYDAEKVKDPRRDVTNDLPGNETVDLSTRLRTDDVLGGGGGACIPDLNVTVWGQGVTLPISGICPYLGYLGYVLVAVASLAAARIVAGTSKG